MQCGGSVAGFGVEQFPPQIMTNSNLITLTQNNGEIVNKALSDDQISKQRPLKKRRM